MIGHCHIIYSNDFVESFIEKPQGDGGWVNAGFMVFEPGFIDKYTTNAQSILESEGLQSVALEKKLAAYKHSGFWHAMDTLRDHTYLTNLWTSNAAPWKLWDENVSPTKTEIAMPNQPLLKVTR